MKGQFKEEREEEDTPGVDHGVGGGRVALNYHAGS